MSRTGMTQRCWEHDYCAPCFYMITVVTEPRRDGLGELRTLADRDPTVTLSRMGHVVRDVWQRASTVYTDVEACECVVMPDHFHGILRVKKRLARPMGHVVKAFKRVSEQESRRQGLLLPKNPGSREMAKISGSRGLLPEPNRVPAAASAAGLWQSGFQDSILLRRGQLKAMVNYIADNPRRLAVKRANPALFTVVANTQVAPGTRCPAIGNRFLLQRPLKRRIQISRRVSPCELEERREALLYAAGHGAVLVSPCISPGEKSIARAALEAGLPLIVILTNGFAPHYKPTGRYFDACAAGRLLMLAPFAYQRRRQTITREQCQELNAWAQKIEETNLIERRNYDSITYD